MAEEDTPTSVEPEGADPGVEDPQIDDTEPQGDTAKPAPTPRNTPVTESWKPPSEEEWRKVTTAHRETCAESKKRKEEVRASRERIAELEAATATAEERAALELEKRLLKEAEDRWRPKVIAAEARSALASAGCTDPATIFRLLDIGKLEIDDDGSVTGLDEQISGLKTKLPVLFRRERPVPPEPQAARPGSTRAPVQKKTATERQVDALLGKH